MWNSSLISMSWRRLTLNSKKPWFYMVWGTICMTLNSSILSLLECSGGTLSSWTTRQLDVSEKVGPTVRGGKRLMTPKLLELSTKKMQQQLVIMNQSHTTTCVIDREKILANILNESILHKVGSKSTMTDLHKFVLFHVGLVGNLDCGEIYSF